MKRERRDVTDPKVFGRATIRHYVIGGHPGESALEGKAQLEYYQRILEITMDLTGLTPDEVERAIEESPDTVENLDILNSKPLYRRALVNIRASQESK